MKDLTQEFTYFNDNLEYLKQKYIDKYIVIKHQKILGAYDSFDEAMETTAKKEEIGTFLIQKVDKNPEAYTIYYNNITILA